MRTPLRILGVTAALSLAVAAVPLLSSTQAQAAKFTGGNLVVYRVGDGASALSNAAAPVFLDEFTPDGDAVSSVALPTAAAGANKPLTAAGQSRSEGLITNSPDGRLLALTGYAAAPGTTGPGGMSLTASDPASVARVVGVVDADGELDTSTTLGSGGPAIIRSAVTNGKQVWAAGGDGGVLTTAIGSGTVTSIAGGATANLGALTVQGGQLFASGILANRLAAVGTGTPKGSATLTDLTGLPEDLLTYGYAFLNLTSADFAGTELDTLYLANSSERGGTVDKYRYNGSRWASAGHVDVEGATGLVADVSGGQVSLAVTTPTELLALTDPNGAGNAFDPSNPTVLATADANTEFRGVALAPTGRLDVPDGALEAGKYGWTDKRVTKSGSWKTYAFAKAPGKKGIASTKKGSSATVTVVGDHVVITFSTGPKAGKAQVVVDGKKTTFNTKAAKTGTIVKKLALGAADSHTVSVKVLSARRVSLALLQVK
ncbi:hypothetical protein [Nocardioides sp. URHA0032]|uniref:hypothetical protein n=1 Tax=Nocardioides sp. URHA0032 TaxID=1380388 RepID=UPI00048F93BA|nr:hypothetical protein [Nocardioides sp. URHA0032]